eukprot:552648-Rhodomonas_salina.1
MAQPAGAKREGRGRGPADAAALVLEDDGPDSKERHHAQERERVDTRLQRATPDPTESVAGPRREHGGPGGEGTSWRTFPPMSMKRSEQKTKKTMGMRWLVLGAVSYTHLTLPTICSV